MTWSLSASGHHNTNDWRAEEHELLRKLVAAVEPGRAGTTVTSSFSFNGNHVQATSVDDALLKLAQYDASFGTSDGLDDAPTAGSGEDDGSTTEPEA